MGGVGRGTVRRKEVYHPLGSAASPSGAETAALELLRSKAFFCLIVLLMAWARVPSSLVGPGIIGL